MRKVFWLLVGFVLVISVGIVQAQDVTMEWDPSEGATGYKIYKSLDMGQTWNQPVDVGLVTTYTYNGVEETGLILFRVSAYNAGCESIIFWAGAWYNHLWKPPVTAGCLGIN